MIFCPQCGSILKPKEKSGKKILWCSCGHVTSLEEEKQKAKEELVEDVDEEKKEEPVIEEKKGIEIAQEIETHPKVKTECEKCGNKEAYYWTQQTRGADEPETRFFKCTECKHCWREYA